MAEQPDPWHHEEEPGAWLPPPNLPDPAPDPIEPPWPEELAGPEYTLNLGKDDAAFWQRKRRRTRRPHFTRRRPRT